MSDPTAYGIPLARPEHPWKCSRDWCLTPDSMHIWCQDRRSGGRRSTDKPPEIELSIDEKLRLYSSHLTPPKTDLH